MAHRQIIPLYEQRQDIVTQDLLDCYTPAQLYGLALHFRVYAKRYWHHKDFEKAKYYYNLYQRILRFKSVQAYLRRNSIQLEIEFVFKEVDEDV